MTSVQVTLGQLVREERLQGEDLSKRIIFGIIWAIDGSLKFMPGLAKNLVAMINQVAQGQPSWLEP